MSKPVWTKHDILCFMAKHADLLISIKARLEGVGYELTHAYFFDAFSKNNNLKAFGRQYEYEVWALMTERERMERFHDLFVLRDAVQKSKIKGPASPN